MSTQEALAALDHAKLSKAHWKVWFLSAMGIFLDGFDLFIIAIALPFIMRAFHPSPLMAGLIVSAAPIGCIFGASVFGRLTDRLGRKTILLLDLLFFVIFAGMTAFAWSVTALIVFRFLLGIGIGADYPVSSTYITENMPKKLRGRMLISGFGFQALGLLAAAGVGIAILMLHPDTNAWRWMLGIAVVPAIIILLFRLTLPESTRWLIHKGKQEKAAEVTAKMTGRKIKLDALKASEAASFLDLFKPRYLRRTILTAGSWFIMDVAFYGIKFFIPVILAAMAFTHNGDFISKDITATKGAAFLDIFLVLGIFLAIWLVDRWGRIKLQSIGFLGMAIGFFMIASSAVFHDHTVHVVMLFAGFILFNLTVNMGPNPITFLLPAELFPTHIRATGHGFAAACGKVGAAFGGILIPYLIATIHIPSTMLVIGIFCLFGFLLTAVMGYETSGKSLDEIGEIQTSMTEAEVALLHVQRDIRRLNNDISRVESALSLAVRALRQQRDK